MKSGRSARQLPRLFINLKDDREGADCELIADADREMATAAIEEAERPLAEAAEFPVDDGVGRYYYLIGQSITADEPFAGALAGQQEGTIGVGRTPKVVPDRREQILDAAVTVFAAKGFDRATNRDIARAAGVTPGLIYHYFASKQELLRSAMERRSPLGLMRAIDARMFELEPEPMLRALFGQMLAVLESDRFVALMKVYLPEVVHDAKLAPLGISIIGEATQALERYVARKMEQGALRPGDPAFVTHFLLGGIMDLVLRRQVLKDPGVARYTREEIIEGAVAMALQGLLPR